MPLLPFIVVSGSVGEDVAVEVMKAGANDYLMKDKLIRLAPAVERELREAESRRRHDAAEAASYRLGLAVEGIAEIVTLYDADDRLVLFNRAFRDLNATVTDDIHLGMTFEELIRVLVSGGLVAEAAGREESWISERLERHRNPGRPMEVARPDGIWLRTNEQRLPDGGTISISLDITEQRRLEQQRRQAEKMEALGVLAGGIAHDFNNMLFAIIGLTESVRIKTPDGDARRPALDGVIEAGERAKELVRQILAFSRQIEPTPRRIDLCAVAEEALRLIRATLPSTIEIRHKLDRSCGDVVADPTQIHQVIVNLAANAADAMEGRPGLLEVGLDPVVVTRGGDNSGVELPSGDYARLTVSDTGRGMDPRHKRRIFDPFFTTKEIGSGTGLGLAVVHGIVTGYGGVIVVSSEEGRGSRFEVYLPSIAVQSEAEPAALAARLTG